MNTATNYEQLCKATEAMQALRTGMWSILCQFKNEKVQIERRIIGSDRHTAFLKAVESLRFVGETIEANITEGKLIALVEKEVKAAGIVEPFSYLLFLIARTERMYEDLQGTIKEMQNRLVVLAQQNREESK